MQLHDLLTLLPHGESIDLDWKRTFPPGYFDKSDPKYAETRAELVKDVAAMANAASEKVGHLVYGIADQNGQRDVHPVIRTEAVDDAVLRQFLARYLDPAPTFEYAEFLYEDQLVGLLQVQRVMPYPHVVRESLGKTIHKGQVFVRKGTLTEIALHADLVHMMAGRKPIVVPYGSPEANRIEAQLLAEGWQLGWPSEDGLDRALADGYEQVCWPGTRRQIECRTGNPPSQAQKMYLVRRRVV